jgi:hypothetical protein
MRHPDPANPGTTISYWTDHPMTLHVEIFDILGRSVYSREMREDVAGYHSLYWNDAELASGVYVVEATSYHGVMQNRKQVQAVKILLIR